MKPKFKIDDLVKYKSHNSGFIVGAIKINRFIIQYAKASNDVLWHEEKDLELYRLKEDEEIMTQKIKLTQVGDIMVNLNP